MRLGLVGRGGERRGGEREGWIRKLLLMIDRLIDGCFGVYVCGIVKKY